MASIWIFSRFLSFLTRDLSDAVIPHSLSEIFFTDTLLILNSIYCDSMLRYIDNGFFAGTLSVMHTSLSAVNL